MKELTFERTARFSSSNFSTTTGTRITLCRRTMRQFFDIPANCTEFTLILSKGHRPDAYRIEDAGGNCYCFIGGHKRQMYSGAYGRLTYFLSKGYKFVQVEYTA